MCIYIYKWILTAYKQLLYFMEIEGSLLQQLIVN